MAAARAMRPLNNRPQVRQHEVGAAACGTARRRSCRNRSCAPAARCATGGTAPDTTTTLRTPGSLQHQASTAPGSCVWTTTPLQQHLAQRSPHGIRMLLHHLGLDAPVLRIDAARKKRAAWRARPAPAPMPVVYTPRQAGVGLPSTYARLPESAAASAGRCGGCRAVCSACCRTHGRNGRVRHHPPGQHPPNSTTCQGRRKPGAAQRARALKDAAARESARGPARRWRSRKSVPISALKRCASGDASTSRPKAGRLGVGSQRNQRNRHGRGRLGQPVGRLEARIEPAVRAT